MEHEQTPQQSEPAQAPAPADACQPAAASPRERTRRHMRRVLGGAAALGFTAAVSLSGCDGGGIVCDPMPQPTINCGETLTSEYVDGFVYQSARWISAKTGDLVLLVSLYTEVPNPTFTTDPTVQGASVIAVDHTDNELLLTLSPTASTASIQLSVPLGCEGKAVTLNLSVDVSATPELDAYVPVTLASN